MKRAIIFDAYGTLISTGNGSVEATQKILNINNIILDAKEVYSHWKKFHRKNIDDINNTGNFESEEKIFEKDLKMVYELYNINSNYNEDVKIMLDTLGKRKVFEDTLMALEELSNKYKLYIGSTTDTLPLMQDIKNNNINIFDGIYTSEDLKIYKPHKDFYKRILTKINCTADEVVFVGDSLNDDVLGPQSIGIYSILLDRKNKYSEDSETKPNKIIKSLLELPLVMKKI